MKDETIPISFKRKICGNTDQSSLVVLPTKFMEFLNWDKGDVLDMVIKKGKHGYYLAVWCKDKQPVTNPNDPE